MTAYLEVVRPRDQVPLQLLPQVMALPQILQIHPVIAREQQQTIQILQKIL